MLLLGLMHPPNQGRCLREVGVGVLGTLPLVFEMVRHFALTSRLDVVRPIRSAPKVLIVVVSCRRVAEFVAVSAMEPIVVTAGARVVEKQAAPLCLGRGVAMIQ